MQCRILNEKNEDRQPEESFTPATVYTLKAQCNTCVSVERTVYFGHQVYLQFRAILRTNREKLSEYYQQVAHRNADRLRSLLCRN